MARPTDTHKAASRLHGDFVRSFGDSDQLAALLASVIEQMPAAVVVAEAPSGEMLIVNPEVRRVWSDPFPISGSVEEYRQYLGFHHDGTPMATEEWPLARSLRDGVVVRDEEVDFVAGDGKLHTVSLSSAPVRDAEGRTIAGVVVFQDVSRRVAAEDALRTAGLELEGRVRRRTEALRREVEERTRIEASLRENEALFRSVFERSAIGIAILDTEARILRANPAMARILGRDLDDLPGRSCSEFTHPEDKALDEELFAALQSGSRDHYRVDKRCVRPDGVVIWTSLTLSSVSSTGGPDAPFAVALLEDVTDRVRAVERLREKDRDIRQAYVDVIASVTGGKLVLMTSPEMSAALGRPVMGPIVLSEARDASLARRRIVERLAEVAPGMEDVEDFVLGAGEAMANALKHAGEGSVTVCVADGGVQVVVADKGPGIDFQNLPSATLLAGFSTKQTLGVGFSLMLEFSDRVLLTTQEGETRVVLERRLGGGRAFG